MTVDKLLCRLFGHRWRFQRDSDTGFILYKECLNCHKIVHAKDFRGLL